MGEVVPITSPGFTKVVIISLSNSSPPRVAIILFRFTLWIAATLSRKSSAVGDGYFRRDSVENYARAFEIKGEWGYGFSFVFNLIISGATDCSPLL